ncbi:MAG: hypothetical protein KDJ88_20050 [Bauldia sp.]|nr:hypothetical protein [Bauldia sp.]
MLRRIIRDPLLILAVVAMVILALSQTAQFAAAALYWKLFPDFRDKRVELALDYRGAPIRVTFDVRCRTVPAIQGTIRPISAYLAHRIRMLISGYPTAQGAHYSGLSAEAPDGSVIFVTPIFMADEICSEGQDSPRGSFFVEVLDRGKDPERLEMFPRIRCDGKAKGHPDLSCEFMRVEDSPKAFVAAPPVARTDGAPFWERALRVIDPNEEMLDGVKTGRLTISFDAVPPTRRYRLLGDGSHCTIGEELRFGEPVVAVREDLMCAVQSAHGEWLMPSDLGRNEWFVLPGPGERLAQFRFEGNISGRRSDTSFDPGFRAFGIMIDYRATD